MSWTRDGSGTSSTIACAIHRSANSWMSRGGSSTAMSLSFGRWPMKMSPRKPRAIAASPRHAAHRGHHALFHLPHTTGCRRPRDPQLDSLTEPYSVHSHDVLVIGAGGAGLRAAIEASAMGAD